MPLCKCGCGQECEKNYKRGCGRRGRKNSEEHNSAMSISLMGRERSKESIEKSRKANLGRKFSEGRNRRISETCKSNGVGKWMKGRKLPENTIKKLVIANTGKVYSEESKLKISVANSGKNNGMFNKKHSQEIREKIGKASRRAWRDQNYYNKIINSKFKNGSIGNPALKTEFKRYEKLVDRITEYNYKLNINEINPSGLKRGLKTNHLDHSYSKFEGFKNNIPPCIIGNYKNLKIISNSLNCSKNLNSDTSLEQLLTNILDGLK